MKRKGGGRLTLDDFLPAFAKKKEATPEDKEAKLKQFLMGLASKHHGR